MTKPFRFGRALTLGCAGLATTLGLLLQAEPSAQQPGGQPVASPPTPQSASLATPASNHRRLLDRYCVTCHNERLKTAGLSLDRIDVVEARCGRRSLGEGGAQGAHGHHAASQHAAAFPGRPPRAVDVAGNIARCGFRRQAEPGPHRNAPPPESNRVSERHQRPAGARHRRRVAPATR